MAYSWPVPHNAPITQYFATNAYSPVQPAGHTGMDFAVPVGTNITAIGAGVVLWADWATKLSPSNPWYIAPAYAGIVVLIDHGNLISVYAHLDSTPLNIGDRVSQNQVIAKSGNTGLSTGPHLHFEVFVDPITGPVNWLANRSNPLNYIAKVSPAPAPTVLKANQRRVGAANLNQRKEAKTSAAVVRVINANTVETFTGFVRGEKVTLGGITSDVWYKDAQGYAWAGGFTSQSTSGLTDQTPIPANWRKTGTAVAKKRAYPRLDAKELGELKPNTQHIMKNWTTGDTWEGSNVWFEYRDGGWIHSKLFTSQATTGLTKVATPVEIDPTWRKTGPSAVNYRDAPFLDAKDLGNLKPDTNYVMKAWAEGDSANGSNVWFQNTGGWWAHSAFFTSQSTASLPKVTVSKPAPAPVPEPEVPVEEAYTFTPDFDFVEYEPAHTTNMQHGNFPDKPTHVVLHQFNARAINPSIEGVISHFQTERPGKESSAHFAVSEDRIVQLVSLKDRAFHAGATGNNWIGIEIDPDQDAKTVASVKRLLTAIQAKYGYLPTYIEHKDVPGASTECGVDIDLALYSLDTPPTPVTPTPPPVTPEEPTNVVTQEQKAQIIREYLEAQLKSL